MKGRPYFNKTTAELEEIVKVYKTDIKTLEVVNSELLHRTRPRANELREKIKKHKQKISSEVASAPKQTENKPDHEKLKPQPQPEPVVPVDLTGLSQEERLMLAWTTLEVLSPQTYLKPESLAGGKAYNVKKFNDKLPWENEGEPSKPNYRLYYHIVLGAVHMKPAVEDLLDTFVDVREERPSGRGKSIIASVLVDKNGVLVGNDAAGISSFAWGLSKALTKDLKNLGRWQSAEWDLEQKLQRKLTRYDKDAKVLPITISVIETAFDWLVSELNLPLDMVEKPSFCVKAYQWFKVSEPPEPLLLNSFYLQDLATAKDLFSSGKAPDLLKKYVGLIKPDERANVLEDPKALSDALSPSRMPLGRWPFKDRNQLVTLQQAAVNLAQSELQDGGILAVNGPPGTGKTTLLKDVVASVIVERAIVMTGFDDPAAAFVNSKERISRGGAFLWLYRLDDRLRGFEMVVASSNNKAVENVSEELPAKQAIADDAIKGGYFKSISDNLHQDDTWGLIAAVLGNANNRFKFQKNFWWHQDFGFSKFLQHAAGSKPQAEYKDSDGKKAYRTPIAIEKEKPASDKLEALQRWKTAKLHFNRALAKAQVKLNDAETAAALIHKMARLSEQRDKAVMAARNMIDQVEILEINFVTLNEQMLLKKAGMDKAKSKLDQNFKARPSFLSRLFRTTPAKKWKLGHLEFISAFKASVQLFGVGKSELADKAIVRGDYKKRLLEISREIEGFDKLKSEFCVELAALQEALGGQFIDESFFNKDHVERNMAVPWLDKSSTKCRDELFDTAMDLHKAFIEAAAVPIRSNLSVLMDCMGGAGLGSQSKDEIITHLWSTLSLVVPLISTTFASVTKLFANVGLEQIGWLLIDEAGQALPQAAVGAMTRSKRAVVVGDPMQIEPIVILPKSLTTAICDEFQIDSLIYSAPEASVQTLADSSSKYMTSFQTSAGCREVGLPLLVHRRCADPMFSISNAIAYENLMVHAKVKKASSIGAVLGASRWIDVVGEGNDKWCKEEGQIVLDLLSDLKANGVAPNLYIVTPFVVVQNQLRQLVTKSGILDEWVDHSQNWPAERIGTIHTVQGREAEAVIFVLGAPNQNQTGARHWAGKHPNLLNVAVSRAQERAYIVGNRRLWRSAGFFAQLDAWEWFGFSGKLDSLANEQD